MASTRQQAQRPYNKPMRPEARTVEPSIFLSGEEVACLTGYKLSAKQVAWLRAKGWRFELNCNKKPIVARKYAEKMLGCGIPEDATYRPNFAALRAH
jgi:hypothetical protein